MNSTNCKNISSDESGFSSLEISEIQRVILSIIFKSQEDLSGFLIAKQLREIDKKFEVGFAKLHIELDYLQSLGLVNSYFKKIESGEGTTRKFFTITSYGKNVLANSIESILSSDKVDACWQLAN